MAIEEFNLATSEKQDAIKAQTDKLSGIQSDVSYLKNNIPDSAPDFGAMRMFEAYGKLVSSNSSAYVTIVEVVGQGYLERATGGGSNNGIQYSTRFRVILDGVVIYENTSDRSIANVGIKTDPTPPTTTNPPIKNIYAPLKFNKSLKIEAMMNYTEGAYTIAGNYTYRYFLK